MRKLIILLALWPSLALAQNHFCNKSMLTASGGGVEYPFTLSGSLSPGNFYFALSFAQDPASSPITSDDGAFSLAVTGTPVRTNDGTYPVGIGGTEGYKWYIPNPAYLTHTDDDTLDLPTKFTWVAVFTNLVTPWTTFVRKYDFGAPADGYQIQRNGTTLQVLTTVSGTQTYHSRSTSTNVGQMSCMVWTFDGTGGAGSSVSNLYIDELSTSNKTNMQGPLANNTADTQINASFNSNFHAAAIVLSEWTEAQARAFCRKFYGLTSDDGNYMSITSATPAATFLTDSGNPSYLVSTSANNAIIGRYGYYAHPDIDNLIQRSSFESWPTWDTSTTAGDGSAAIAQVSTATAAHGLSHISMTLQGTTSAAETRSACVTTGIASDLYVQAQIKKGSGTTEAAVKIHEFSDGACTTSLGTTDIVAATDVTTSWAEYGGKFAAASWNGSTASWRIELHETCNGDCDSHWDAIQARSASVPTSSYCVVCDTDATCSCSATDSTIPQPLTTGGWKVSLTARSNFSSTARTTTGTRANMFNVPGTAGSNNFIRSYWASGALYFDVYDSGGTQHRVTFIGDMSANTDYLVEAYHYANGDIKVCVDGSCGSTTSGANMDGVSSTFYVGTDGSTGGDLWIRNLKAEPL